jgi:hypothetical protein
MRRTCQHQRVARFRTGFYLVRRQVSFVQLDRHDAQDVHPLGLVLEDLPQLRLGGFLGQEEVQRFTGYLRAGEGVDAHLAT